MGDCYLNDLKISSIQGYPYNDSIPYFPAFIVRENQATTTDIDDVLQKIYSSVLYSAQEPILYNYYLGISVYRFTWLRTFHKKIILSFSRNNTSINLTTIQLEFSGSGKGDAVVLSDETKPLTVQDWEEFERLLHAYSFWSAKPCIDDQPARDGSSWIIEAHVEDRYWFVNRWSPDVDFSKAGEFLIAKSGLDEIIY